MKFKKIRYVTTTIYVLAGFGCLFPAGIVNANTARASDDWISSSIRIALASETSAGHIHYLNNGEWERFELRGMSFSAPRDYRGPVVLNFYNEIPSEDNPQPSPIASCDLSEQGPGESILVFIPNPRKKGRFHIHRIPGGNESFPAETVLFANLTQSTIAGVFDESSAQLAPGENALLDYKGSAPRTGNSLRIRMAVKERQNEAWSLVYNATIPSRGSDRRWLVLYVGSGPKAFIYPDYRPHSN